MWRWLAIAAVGIYLLGFVLFVTCLPKAPGDLHHIQGIVALTGGEMRIDAAYRLFRRGAAQRLLISGVYPGTSREKLIDLVGVAAPARTPDEMKAKTERDRAIDIGYAAENTLGNAREAAAWARFYHFNTLLIVTARYHMPRTLSEFREALPGVTLVPYPIDPESLPRDWWRHAHAIRVLHGEYAKYLAATVLAVLGLEPKRNEAPASA